MAKTTPAQAPEKQVMPELETEFASRLRDPFEQLFMGLIQPNDPLLIERGAGAEIYRDLKRDGKVFDGLQKRQLALIGKPWQVEPVEPSEQGTKDAEVVTAILKRASFDRLCADLLEALLAGFAVVEVVWTVQDGLVVPSRLVRRSPRRFKYVQPSEDAGVKLHLLVQENMLTGVPVPERKFIVHRVNAEDDNPYGTGLGLQLYWPVFFKRKAVVSWNKLNDRVGSPTLHGEYPRGASRKEKDTLADALQAFSADGFVLTPEGMKVNLIEAKLQGNTTLQQALCEYMDDWISAVLLGQASRSNAGGALAAASKERADVRADLTQADSDLLSDTINNTLLAWLCELNGFAPCQVWRQIKRDEDRLAMAQTDQIVAGMGFKPTLDAVRAKYGEGWDEAAPGTAPPTAPARIGFAEPVARAAQYGEGDEVDALVRQELQAWQPLLQPMVDPLQALLDTAHQEGLSAQELMARLPSALAAMDDSQLREALTRMAVAARGSEAITP